MINDVIGVDPERVLESMQTLPDSRDFFRDEDEPRLLTLETESAETFDKNVSRSLELRFESWSLKTGTMYTNYKNRTSDCDTEYETRQEIRNHNGNPSQ